MSDRFDPLPVAGRFGHVIVIPKDGGRNMLKSAIWQELRELDWIIRNITVKYEDEEFTYDKICAQWNNECVKNNILNLHHIMKYACENKRKLMIPCTDAKKWNDAFQNERVTLTSYELKLFQGSGRAEAKFDVSGDDQSGPVRTLFVAGILRRKRRQ